MAFRFGLEPVLKHRKRLEEMAQRVYAEAQAAVDECLRRLEAMYQRLDEVRDEIGVSQRSGAIAHICASETFISGHKIRIETVRQEARALLVIAEDAQEKLVAAAREKKVLVKLKEKKLDEYRARLEQIEAKERDDQTQMRQAWRKK